MGITGSITRVIDYYSRHGFGATIRRSCLQARRALLFNRMVVYYCDLAKQTSLRPIVPCCLQLERLRTYPELSPADLQQMTSFWNPRQALRNIKQRFERGASLWLIRSGKRLAGYGWTLQGHTITPHYFRLGPDDVHLFDFHVFAQYRGQGLNPLLVTHILRNLATECGGRGFIEAAEWNEAQLASLRKTPFHRLGSVRKFNVLGHTVVCWDENEPRRHEQIDKFKNPSLGGSGREGRGLPDLRV